MIVGSLVGIGLVLAFSQKARESAGGICAVVLGQSARKQGNKEKILAILRERARSSPSPQSNSGQAGQGELSNSDIREALGVSAKTAVNYLDELEREGKVEQVGNTGQSVKYRLKS